MSGSVSPCLLVSVSVSLLSFDNRAARVIAAVRANDVRWLHRATLGAGLKLLCRKSVVRTAHAGPRIRLFAFGNTHDRCLSNKALIGNFDRLNSLKRGRLVSQGRRCR
jgi:hypothetical protein